MELKERLIYAIEIVTEKAEHSLGSFKNAVGQAEGTVGKFKAGVGNAFDQIQAHAGMLALGAGGALIGFAEKSVEAFTEGALGAGKMADATGLLTEDASRWRKIAEDFGVPADAMTGNFVKLEKAISANSPAVKALGLEVVKTADGHTDMNATMLRAIELLGRVPDAEDKARYASQLFGKGFADSAEIVLGNADDIKERLKEVSDAEVFDPEEVKNARDLRDAMHELKDRFEAVMLQVGGSLAPTLTELAKTLTQINDAAESIHLPEILEFGVKNNAINSIAKMGSAVKGLFTDSKSDAEKAEEAMAKWASTESQDLVQASIDAAEAEQTHAEELAKVRTQGDMYVSSLIAMGLKNKDAADAARQKMHADEDAAAAAKQHRDAIDQVAAALDKQLSAMRQLVGGDIAVRESQRQAKAATDEYTAAVNDATVSEDDRKAALDRAVDAQLNAAAAAADYRARQMEANGETVDAKTQNQLFQEELLNLAAGLTGPVAGALVGYAQQLEDIPRNVTTVITLKNGNVYSSNPGLTHAGVGQVVIGAKGAIVRRPTAAIIGEAGDEAVIPLDRLNGNSALPSELGGGGGGPAAITLIGSLTVQAGFGVDGFQVGRQIVEVIDNYLRSGGQFGQNTLRLIRGASV